MAIHPIHAAGDPIHCLRNYLQSQPLSCPQHRTATHHMCHMHSRTLLNPPKETTQQQQRQALAVLFQLPACDKCTTCAWSANSSSLAQCSFSQPHLWPTHPHFLHHLHHAQCRKLATKRPKHPALPPSYITHNTKSSVNPEKRPALQPASPSTAVLSAVTELTGRLDT